MTKSWYRRLARLNEDFWELESGEARHEQCPEKFWIPPRRDRDNLRPGQSVRLLFQIEGENENGGVETNVERMWAIVAGRVGDLYIGVLDNQPATIEPGLLDEGDEFMFRAEHVIDIDDPPQDYLIEKYGDRLNLPKRG